MTNKDYFIGNDLFKEKIIVITGCCRSGKTTLSKLLGTTKEVEWIEEPYPLMLLAELVCIGKLDTNIFSAIFPAICKEIINDHVLLRNANFRANDLSSIWNYKEGSEIFNRLINLKTREDVKQYILKEKKIFLFDIPEILPAIELLRKCCPNALFIHVIRDVYDVADAVYRKKWYSNENIVNVKNNTPFRDYFSEKKKCIVKIPWWLSEGKEELFCEVDEYERGIMYWCGILKTCLLNGNLKNNKCYDLLVKYEDLVEDPDKILKIIGERISLTTTPRTSAVKKELCIDYDVKLENRNSPLCHENREEMERIKRFFSYE